MQSIHIVAIGVVLGSVLMTVLRILGQAGHDQTLTETAARFVPWTSWALGLLLVSGAVMVVGEPVRELLALSFWLKMVLVATGTAITVVFQRSLRRHAEPWETAHVNRRSIRALALVTLLIWISVVVLGRLIAYDYVWGSWSSALKG